MLDRTSRLKRARMERADRNGSPLYPEFHGIIAAGASEYREIRATFPDARKYEPLDAITVTNNSDENLKLYLNGTLVKLVAARSIVAIDNSAIWNYKIENISATNTVADEIEVTCQREGLTVDKLAQRDYA
jgi:hypothetical protein